MKKSLLGVLTRASQRTDQVDLEVSGGELGYGASECLQEGTGNRAQGDFAGNDGS